jgi:hypothetical protein
MRGSSAAITRFFTTRRSWFLLGVVLFLVSWVGFAFVHVWYRQKIFHVGQQIHAVELKISQLRRRESILQAKVAQIHEPTILQRCAQQLKGPQRDRMVYVSLGEVRREKQRVVRELAAGRNPSSDRGKAKNVAAANSRSFPDNSF